MAEVFLYTPEANINSMHLKALREAGFVTVKVADMSAVKQMAAPVPIPQADVDAVTTAAFEAVIKGPDFVRRDFGTAVARILLGAQSERTGA